MLIVFAVSCISLLLAYLSSIGAFKKGLEYSFVIIAVFFSIRYCYGSDYLSYQALFEDINKVKSVSEFFNLFLTDTFVFSEIGWKVLNVLFNPLGFYALVAALTIFEYYVYYIVIKKYVPQAYQWLAVFVFLFNPYILLLQLSMMREALAIVLLLLAFHKIIIQKKYHAIVCVLIAITIHKSSLFVLPIFLYVLYGKNKKRLSAFLLVLIYVLLIVYIDEVAGLIFSNFEEEFIGNYTKYEDRVGTLKISFSLAYFLDLIPFVLMILYIWNNKTTSAIKQFVILSVFSYALTPVVSVYNMLERFIYYFLAFTLVGIPVVYSSVNNKVIRYGLIVIYVGMTLNTYFVFLKHPTWIDSYSTYRTIFELL